MQDYLYWRLVFGTKSIRFNYIEEDFQSLSLCEKMFYLLCISNEPKDEYIEDLGIDVVVLGEGLLVLLHLVLLLHDDREKQLLHLKSIQQLPSDLRCIHEFLYQRHQHLQQSAFFTFAN